MEEKTELRKRPLRIGAKRVAVNITLAFICVWMCGGSANTSGLKEGTDLTDSPLSSCYTCTFPLESGWNC